jgi:hypothetical protein
MRTRILFGQPGSFMRYSLTLCSQESNAYSHTFRAAWQLPQVQSTPQLILSLLSLY